jgi:hypothetical protein
LAGFCVLLPVFEDWAYMLSISEQWGKQQVFAELEADM